MEASSPLIVAIIGLVTGFILGLGCYRFFSKGEHERSVLKQTLLQREHQIAELKKDMGSHVMGIHQRLANIRFEADQLEQQVESETAQWTLSTVKPTLTAETPHPVENSSQVDMPRDYAAGKNGTLSEDFGLKDSPQTQESAASQPPRY